MDGAQLSCVLTLPAMSSATRIFFGRCLLSAPKSHAFGEMERRWRVAFVSARAAAHESRSVVFVGAAIAVSSLLA